MNRTTIFLGEPDRQAIRMIKERFGVSTDSDAIRLALRVLAESERVEVVATLGRGNAEMREI